MLRRETETVYPSELIECDEDRQLGETLLSAILGTPVRIIRTENGWLCRKEGG